MLFSNLKLATMADALPYGLIEDGAVLVENGRIAWAGSRQDAPASMSIDCGGRLLTPGLIDCHTHLVYGGNRANEFELRLNGASYADIAKVGGGILSTVRATREASEEQLTKSAAIRLENLLAEGVTTIEIKSGYGLDIDTELKMLRTARRQGSVYPVDIITSYLGAHAFPSEYREDHAGYVDLVCNDALPTVAREKLADAVDGFCEGIAFSVAEMEKVFAVARKLGLPIKLHAEQLSNLGGARLAAGYGALSVDHIEYLDEDGVADIARAGTVAVLLPGAFYYLKEKQHPPVAALRAHKVPIAIATDLNPGSSPVHSLLAIMNMACVLFGLTPEESLRGVTVNAARALGLSDRGVIAQGMKADFVLWNAERPGDLSYPLGFNPCAAVVKNGDIVRGSL
ncbi:MAG: imidazolonepropionase [Alphaproteobacteria bacterium]|nr:MAG: imidazolonepropionase [Alphaproteobacteria bacterium]